jgi:ubiquinone/menaquinone biosynthesis C-methylase UbiE
MLTRLIATLRMVWLLGPLARFARAYNGLIRYHMLDVLREVQFFAYLETPRTYDDIIQRWRFEDNDYTRDMLTALCGPDGVLLKTEAGYQLDPARPLPTPDYLDRLPAAVKEFAMFEHYGPLVIQRMRGELVTLPDRLEEQADMLYDFDDMLTNRMYRGMRIGAHIWARSLLGDLEGKTLLDVGCGAGVEVAHLWQLLEGKVKITAVDPVLPMVDMNRERFQHQLDILQTTGMPLTDENMATFAIMGAEQLDFPDQHFDMVFHVAMLHWTSDKAQSVKEMLRVLKVGGVIYGNAPYKPLADDFHDLFIRITEDASGFPTKQELADWHRANGAAYEELMFGVYRARKTQHVG